MFGRRGYEAFAPVWSGSPDHAAYQELHKFVVSSRMAAEDLAGESGPITVLRVNAG